MTEPRVLRLDTARSTLLLITTGRGVPELCHFGRRLHAPDSAAQLAAALERPVPQGSLDRNPPRSVFAETGTGFGGYPALVGDRGGRDWTTGFEAAGWDRLDEVTARLSLTDPLAALTVEIEYRLDDTEVLTVLRRLRNDGDAPYRVDWLAGVGVRSSNWSASRCVTVPGCRRIGVGGEWLAVEGVQLPISSPETALLVHCRREAAAGDGENAMGGR